MSEQCRHNRGSFLSWFFFFLIKEELRDTVGPCHCVVQMYTCTCIQRVCGGSLSYRLREIVGIKKHLLLWSSIPALLQREHFLY